MEALERLRRHRFFGPLWPSKSVMPGSGLPSSLGNLDEVVVVADGDTDW